MVVILHQRFFVLVDCQHTTLREREREREERHNGDKSSSEQKRDSFSIHILDNMILRSLENPAKLENYDGTWDTDEHVKHVDNEFDYYHVQGVMKCKLFILTIKGSSMT